MHQFSMHHTVSIVVSSGKNEEVIGAEPVRLEVRDVQFPHMSYFTVEIPRARLIMAMHATKSPHDKPLTLLGALVK